MTINEVINEVDALHRNSFDVSQKVAWLSRADSIVQRMVLDGYENSGQAFSGYTSDTPGDTELLMPAPFDAAYKHYLSAQIHHENQEMDKYNGSISEFDALFNEYSAWYRRLHAVSRCQRFRF